MDRNGKKPKAVDADAHLERSDTKAQTRDVLGKPGASAQADGARDASGPRTKGASKARRS